MRLCLRLTCESGGKGKAKVIETRNRICTYFRPESVSGGRLEARLYIVIITLHMYMGIGAPHGVAIRAATRYSVLQTFTPSSPSPPQSTLGWRSHPSPLSSPLDDELLEAQSSKFVPTPGPRTHPLLVSRLLLIRQVETEKSYRPSNKRRH